VLAVAAGLFFGSPPDSPGQVPQIISYQGRVLVGNNSFDGAGQFKFALVNSGGTSTFWSNDGSSSQGSEPLHSVGVDVHQGLFTVLLGDTALTNMQAIPSTVFANSDVRLRIWFSVSTNGFTQLAPDQRVTAVGYALMAATVPDGALNGAKLAPATITSVQLATNSVTIPALLNGAVTSPKLAVQAVTTTALADGAVTAAKLAAQSVTSAVLANGAVGSAQLAVNAVTSTVLANGSVTQAKLNFELGYIDARNPPYGAKGDGLTDDSTAIQNALNAAAASGGGIVFLPVGNYLIASQLSVPAQTTLAGVWRAPAAGSQGSGTTLLAVANAGNTSGVPFITLQGNNSTLEGITVFYPNQTQTDPPVPYPWAIAGGGGENVTVQNVLLINPYLGIDLATHPSARHMVRGVYGQPLLVGIAVDQCYDIGRIMDIHFWPFWTQNASVEAFQARQAVTFDFMRTDWEVVQDVFSWGYNIGARFRASANGAMNGQMSNVNFDNVDVGLQLSATQPYAVHISNLNIANAGGGTNHIGIQGLPGACELNVNGATFWGVLRQPVSWNSTGLLSLSNARFLNWDATLPAIDVLSGRALLQGNYFTDSIGMAIRVRSTTDHVMVLGNMLLGNSVSLAGPHTTSASNQP
jgi:hypothetical protein